MTRVNVDGKRFSFSRWRENVAKADEGGGSDCRIARSGATLIREDARAELSRRRER